MEWQGETLRLSATDLVGHLNCGHLTQLDRAVAAGDLKRPFFQDPGLEILWERGARHEREYIEHLRAEGLQVTSIEGVGVDTSAVAMTRQAMQSGAPVIIQGALQSGRWIGRADVLRRVERPSQLGAWSYEPLDTKLARETKSGAVLQLCLYASLLEDLQGIAPELAYVVAPWTGFEPKPYRVADYLAYFRRVRASLERSLETEAEEGACPDPVEFCEVCRWRSRCSEQRRGVDHLSLVAGISNAQTNELREHGITTLSELAQVPIPLPWRPARGARQSYQRIREQARIQLEGRLSGELRHELLPPEPGQGFARLPEPCEADIFLDLEGDAFVGEHGLEYMFGYAWRDEQGVERYTADCAFTREHERQVFERFVDFAMERWQQFPNLHIYHFAPYEPAALKRLMGRYATREEELDQLLRAEVFVDLYSVVRNGLRASVESYSIKRLEPFYGYVRDVALPDANLALTRLQGCLELDDINGISADDRAAVEAYNRDDCISTWRLRNWLEQQRARVIAAGSEIDRPIPKTGAPNPDTEEWLAKIAPIVEHLLIGVPDDVELRTPEQHGRWLLGNMLDFHRREEKATHWERFRLRDLSADELKDEATGVAGLVFEGVVGGGGKTLPIHRYSFPPQELRLRPNSALHAVAGAKWGTLVDWSDSGRTIDVKKRKDSIDVHPEAAFAALPVFPREEMEEALLRFGKFVAVHGLEGPGSYLPARDLLLRQRPRLVDGAIQAVGEDTLQAALRLSDELDCGVLPVQGPPGAGKTFTAGRMICSLVAQGKTVGVTANSHSVVRNLLKEAIKAAEKTGQDLNCLQKLTDKQDDLPRLSGAYQNPEVFAAIGPNGPVIGGVAWLWSRPEAFECIDILFVDEAAQMSLANVLAVSQCAKLVILLGDPQQLDQPMQGSHPEGTDVSALHHILDGEKTLSADRGLFLEETWRLPPSICAFTSELFYQDRLRSHEGLEQQEIRNAGVLSGSGLRFLAVPHEGNQNASFEEADRVAMLVEEVLARRATWIDGEGNEEPLTLEKIRIIAPYNAQVFELQSRLPPGALVGTVDKFQGQEAPLVIYSMTTSSRADAPRGMEFLYSLNRFNVATSRAQCVCVLVASPAVLEADCKTPRQMQLVNAYCRYLELAETL